MVELVKVGLQLRADPAGPEGLLSGAEHLLDLLPARYLQKPAFPELTTECGDLGRQVHCPSPSVILTLVP
ncbi:hypothetical protein [Actinoallomurus liliacearum]|uniref:hypothetical protein n=1 Tax=Actinoallomurus liliacearum TaxID=1080073 RepID=UPI0031E8388B